MDEDDEELEAEEEDIEDEDGDWLCLECRGSGEGMFSGTICRACHGLGVIHGENLEGD